MILASVPFSVTVNGGPDYSALVEIYDAGGALLASGPVAAGQAREFRNISIASRDALPLQVRAGDAVHEISRPFAPGWVPNLTDSARKSLTRRSANRTSRSSPSSPDV